MPKKAPELTINEIMGRIDKEIQLRQQSCEIKNKETNNTNTVPKEKEQLEQTSNTYYISDFTRYNDVAFINNAYELILQREPDPHSKANFLERLRSGEKTKVEIITSLLYSKEGREHKVKIKGTKIRYLITLIYKIPVISYVAKLIIVWLSLPRVITRLNQHESHIAINGQKQENTAYKQYKSIQKLTETLQKQQQILQTLENSLQKQQQVIQVQQSLLQEQQHSTQTLEGSLQKQQQLVQTLEGSQQKQQQLTQTLEGSQQKQQQITQTLEGSLQKQQQLTQTLEASLYKQQMVSDVITQQLTDKINYHDFNSYKEALSGVKHYMRQTQQNIQTLVEDARQKLPEERFNETELLQITAEEDHKYDNFYVEFEQQYRGTKEDIKNRIKVYLPYLENMTIDKQDLHALDVGCGRGEWLELLSENCYQVKGIDLNRIMVATLQKQGYDVIEMDVIRYLKTLKNESLALITGFHIIEHLPFKTIMSLFEQSLRVLKKGGMVIFETPNPENILVAAHYFYLDPTHIAPLVPATTHFMLQQSGFHSIQIKRLHPGNETDINDKFIKEHFNNEMDYALIGYK